MTDDDEDEDWRAVLALRLVAAAVLGAAFLLGVAAARCSQ